MIHDPKQVINEMNNLEGNKRVYVIELCVHGFQFVIQIIIWNRGKGKIKYNERIDENKRHCNIIVSVARLIMLIPHEQFALMDDKNFYISPAMNNHEDIFSDLKRIEENLLNKESIHFEVDGLVLWLTRQL